MEKSKEKESKMKKDSNNSPTKSPYKSPLKIETSPKKFNTIFLIYNISQRTKMEKKI